MAKYASIVAGSVVTIVGLLGLLVWRADLVILMKGSLPLLMVFAGAVAVAAGIGALKDEAVSKKVTPKR
jgi:hypothetical protein